MIKKPMFTFKDETSTGIEQVPIEGIIFINNYFNYPKAIKLIDNTGFTSSSTVQDLIESPSSWEAVAVNTLYELNDIDYNVEGAAGLPVILKYVLEDSTEGQGDHLFHVRNNATNSHSQAISGQAQSGYGVIGYTVDPTEDINANYSGVAGFYIDDQGPTGKCGTHRWGVFGWNGNGDVATPEYDYIGSAAIHGQHDYCIAASGETYGVDGIHKGGNGLAISYGTRGALETITRSNGPDSTIKSGSAGVYGYINTNVTTNSVYAVKGIVGDVANANTNQQYGFYTNVSIWVDDQVLPFTAGHNITTDETLVLGDIVEVTDNYLIELSNSLVKVSTTTTEKSKNVYGVVSGVNTNKFSIISGYKGFYDIEYIEENNTVNTTKTIKPEHEEYVNNILSDNSMLTGKVNSVGEGGINVCEINGNISRGDYICSSSVKGKGQKQDDDILHSYTVAKSLEDVDWSQEIPGQNGCYTFNNKKCKMIGCTYHCA